MNRDNSNSGKRKKEGRYIGFIKVAKFVTIQSVPMYSHRKSPHTYSFAQLLLCVLLKIYMKNISYRDLEELLACSTDVRRALGLRTVPDHSTLNRAQSRVSGKQVQRFLEKVLWLIATRVNRAIVLGCDSTGFKEDAASFYYALPKEWEQEEEVDQSSLSAGHKDTGMCV
jgi:Transposase domain (DUF772).